MNLTRRCDYALRIIRAVYRQGDNRRSIAEIAEEEGIPYSFARTIQNDLTKSGIIETSRGANGGVTLGCDPEKVTVKEILEIVQGSISIAPCSADPSSCTNSSWCTYNEIWRGADDLLDGYFANITLDDVLHDR